MLANFFGKSNPANLLLIILVFLGYFFANYFANFHNLLSDDFNWIVMAELIELQLLLFFFFNFILAKNKLTLQNSYGFLFFILLFGILPVTMFDRESVIIHLLFLIYVRRVLSLRTSKSVILKIYDSGLWLGVLFLMNSFTIVFYILLLIMVSLFQKLTPKTFLISITGLITPLIIYLAYCVWFLSFDDFLSLFIFYTDYDFSLYADMWLTLLLIIGFSLIIIVLKSPKIISISGSYRKFWIWTIACLLINVLYVILYPNKTGGELMILFFPLSILLANLVEQVERRLFKNLVLGLFLFMSFVPFII